MQTPSSTPESFPHSLLRGALAFGISFTLIDLIFCLLDILLNSGTPAFGMNSFWNGRWIYMEVLACGIGTAWLGMKVGKQRAWISGLAVGLGLFLLYRLLMLVTVFSNPTTQVGTMRILSVFLPFILYGLVVGGGLAWNQRERKQWGWYEVAGVLGFTLGWLVLAYSGTAVMLQIRTMGIEGVIVGSLWYFAYWLVPTLLYGLVIGACLGLAARGRGEKVSSLQYLHEN